MKEENHERLAPLCQSLIPQRDSGCRTTSSRRPIHAPGPLSPAALARPGQRTGRAIIFLGPLGTIGPAAPLFLFSRPMSAPALAGTHISQAPHWTEGPCRLEHCDVTRFGATIGVAPDADEWVNLDISLRGFSLACPPGGLPLYACLSCPSKAEALWGPIVSRPRLLDVRRRSSTPAASVNVRAIPAASSTTALTMPRFSWPAGCYPMQRNGSGVTVNLGTSDVRQGERHVRS